MGLLAMALLAIAVDSLATSAVLVEALPGGGWTPEETTSAVDAAHAALARSSLGVVVVVIVEVAVPLLVAIGRRRAPLQ